MPTYTIYMLDALDISVSGGGSLSGITQGDGSHLVGRTITLNSNAWNATRISDDDENFDDNDRSQRLDGAQTINGVTYASGTVVEAEYLLILTDPATGQTWTVIGYNVVNSTQPFATVEGLAFIGGVAGFPPIGIPLTVTRATEGPGDQRIAPTPYGSYASPPCLTPGTLIETPGGPRRIELLRKGDLILTRDHGTQPLRWIGRIALRAGVLSRLPHLRPIRIARNALGPGWPARDLLVSPQHRVLITGWQCELFFGEAEMLVAAKHLLGWHGVEVCSATRGVTYIHLMFDRHEVIMAENVWTESLFSGGLDDLMIPTAARDELRAILARRKGGPEALSRPAVRRVEAQLLSPLVPALP
ncbi:MAG: Hint domain-containing protein [Gemmobacter sp.]